MSATHGPLDGRFVRSVDDAPLLCAADPRADVPAELSAYLSNVFASRDEQIVRGWLAAIVEPAQDAGAS